jgi:hypothetical protein
MGEEIGEIFFVGRREQRFRRTADAKPGKGRERLVRGDAAAKFWQLSRNPVREICYAPSPIASWPGSA